MPDEVNLFYGYTFNVSDFITSSIREDVYYVPPLDKRTTKKKNMKTNKIIYSKSFREFLGNSPSRIAKMLFSKIDVENSIYITTEFVNYLTFRNNGNISFLPNGKQCVYSDRGNDTWSRENRQEGKSAKVIRKILTQKAIDKFEFKDKDFEQFSNSYKSTFNDEEHEFSILPNTEINDVYNMDICEGHNSLNGSCMNGDGHYMDIYKNCNFLQILVLKNKNGYLCGRALLWNIEGITLMDRIYVSHEHLYEAFIEYCEKNKWWRKLDYKSYDDKTIFLVPENDYEEDKYVNKTFKINTPTDFDNYPYIDTFAFGGDGWLSNESGYNKYTYNNTDGTREGDEDSHYGETYDDIDDEWICEDDCVYIDRGQKVGYYTHIDNCVMIGSDWWWKDDNAIVYCETDDESYEKVNCVYSEHQNDWILIGDSVTIDGKIYHENNIPENLLITEQ